MGENEKDGVPRSEPQNAYAGETIEHDPTKEDTEVGSTKAPTLGDSNAGQIDATLIFSPAVDVVDQQARSSSAIPKSVGDYKIMRVLGRGGMGIVYHAQHRKLAREVALKMVLSGAHASAEQLARFITEAKAVAHLQHPNIVQIFEVAEQAGLPYFSLEFVDGQPLDELLRERLLEDREAAELMETLCLAIQYAHDNNILHRDLKPANVLLSKAGTPKITDFGLAKNLEDADDGSSTRTGTIMGTPSYMSPEQAQGQVSRLGPATDQYSLGAMLYEFLTGRPPFLGAKPIETIMQVVREEPVPPRQLRAKCPVDLETICLKALQKEPEKRYESCTALADDLRRYLDGIPIAARPVGNTERAWRWCKRNPTVAGLSTAAAFLLAAVTIVSSYSALTLATKNEQLETRKDELQNANEQLEQSNTRLGETNVALNESNEEGVRRSQRLQAYVQDVFRSSNDSSVDRNPIAKKFRDSLLQRTFPVLDEIISELPETAQAVPTKMAGLYSLARSYRDQEMGAEAEASLLKLIKLAEERILLMEGSDAARNNLALFLSELSSVRLQLSRDFDSSLAAINDAVKLAEGMVNEPKASPNGKGRMPKYKSQSLLASLLAKLASNYYRLGDSQSAAPIFERVHQLQLDILASLNDGSAFAEFETDDEKISDAVKQREIKSIEQQVSHSYLALAEAKMRSGDAISAAPLYRIASDEANALLAADPKSPIAMRRTLGVEGMNAVFLAQTGSLEQAITIFESCCQQAEQLLELNSESMEFRRAAAVAFYYGSQWHPDPRIAKQWGERARSIRQDLADAEPEDSKYRLELMPSLARLGDPIQASEIAESFANSDKPDSEIMIETAKAFSLLAARDQSPEAALVWIEKSKAAMQKAVRLGLRDLDYFKLDPDLAELNAHIDISEFATEP